MCYSWKTPQGTAQTGYWLNNTHLGDFTETHYLNEQINPKTWVTTTPACTRRGPANLAWQRIPLTSTPQGTATLTAEPQAGFPATGPLSWSLSPCMQVGVTVTFSVSWTKTSTQALSFALVLQIKRRGVPPKSYVYCHPRGRVPLQTELLLPSMIESGIQHFCAFYLKLRSPYYVTILSNITFI